MDAISFNLCLFQVSAIEQDILEVDPDTKEMLKMLVSVNNTTYRACWIYGEWDLWGLIFTHKSEWGFMGIYNILQLSINPH